MILFLLKNTTHGGGMCRIAYSGGTRYMNNEKNVLESHWAWTQVDNLHYFPILHSSFSGLTPALQQTSCRSTLPSFLGASFTLCTDPAFLVPEDPLSSCLYLIPIPLCQLPIPRNMLQLPPQWPYQVRELHSPSRPQCQSLQFHAQSFSETSSLSSGPGSPWPLCLCLSR